MHHTVAHAQLGIRSVLVYHCVARVFLNQRVKRRNRLLILSGLYSTDASGDGVAPPSYS